MTNQGWVIQTTWALGSANFEPLPNVPPQSLEACKAYLATRTRNPSSHIFMFRILNEETGDVVNWPIRD